MNIVRGNISSIFILKVKLQDVLVSKRLKKGDPQIKIEFPMTHLAIVA